MGTPGLAHALGDLAAGGLEASEAEVNGSPAMIVWAGGEVFAVYIPVIDPIVDGGKITAVYTVAAPDKLAVASRQARVSRNAGLSGQ